MYVVCIQSNLDLRCEMDRAFFVALRYAPELSPRERPSSLFLYIADGEPIRWQDVTVLDVHDAVRVQDGDTFDTRVAAPSVPYLREDSQLVVCALAATGTEDGLCIYRSAGTSSFCLSALLRADGVPCTQSVCVATSKDEPFCKGSVTIVRASPAAPITYLAAPEPKVAFHSVNMRAIADYVKSIACSSWDRAHALVSDPTRDTSDSASPMFVRRNQFPSYPRYAAFGKGGFQIELPMAMYLHIPGRVDTGRGVAHGLLRAALWRHGLDESWWLRLARAVCASHAPELEEEELACLAVLAEAAAFVPASLPYADDEVDMNRPGGAWRQSLVDKCEVVGKMLNTMGNDCEDAAAAAVDMWLSFWDLPCGTSEVEDCMRKLSRFFVPVSVLGLARAESGASGRIARSRTSVSRGRIRDRGLHVEDVFGHKWAMLLPVPHLSYLARTCSQTASLVSDLPIMADVSARVPPWLCTCPPLVAEGTGPTWPIVRLSSTPPCPFARACSASDGFRGAVGSLLSAGACVYGDLELNPVDLSSDFYVTCSVIDMPACPLLTDPHTGLVLCQLLVGHGLDAHGKLHMGAKFGDFVQSAAALLETGRVRAEALTSLPSAEYGRITRVMRFTERPSLAIHSAECSVSPDTRLPWGEFVHDARRAIDAAIVELRARRKGKSYTPGDPGWSVYYIPASSISGDTPLVRHNLGELFTAMQVATHADVRTAEVFAGHTCVEISLQ